MQGQGKLNIFESVLMLFIRIIEISLFLLKLHLAKVGAFLLILDVAATTAAYDLMYGKICGCKISVNTN